MTIKAQSNYFGAETFEWYIDGSPEGTTSSDGHIDGYHYSSKTFSSLSAGTSYLIEVNVYDNLTFVESGSGSFSTDSSRPSNFSWTNTFTSGSDVNITAAEWNDFQTRINEFRVYKGLSNYSFTSVVSGNDMLAPEFNAARTAINDMSPPTAPPSAVIADTTDITAAYLIDIKDALNSIA